MNEDFVLTPNESVQTSFSGSVFVRSSFFLGDAKLSKDIVLDFSAISFFFSGGCGGSFFGSKYRGGTFTNFGLGFTSGFTSSTGCDFLMVDSLGRGLLAAVVEILRVDADSFPVVSGKFYIRIFFVVLCC